MQQRRGTLGMASVVVLMPELAVTHQDPSMLVFTFTRSSLEAEHSEQILMTHAGGNLTTVIPCPPRQLNRSWTFRCLLYRCCSPQLGGRHECTFLVSDCWIGFLDNMLFGVSMTQSKTYLISAFKPNKWGFLSCKVWHILLCC